jgi:lambda repressor-like predicted transcriptional regulator
MEIASSQPRRWVGALVVTAAAAFAFGPAGKARAQGTAELTPVAQPLAEAGWHGRPIRHPQSTPPVRIPAGDLHRSVSVREVQRMLLRIGYAVGPVDGILGIRTRSAIQWFQIKHRFRPTGVVDARMLSYLRSRTGVATMQQPKLVRHAGPVPETHVATPSVIAAPPEARQPDASRRHPGGLRLALVALVVVLAVAALTLLAIAVRRGRRPATRQRMSAPERDDTPRAIGYATGRDRDELERHAAAIQQACEQRGWTLACLVRDGGAARRGLASALHQISGEAAPRLVVGRLDHLGRSLKDVAVLLGWCTRADVTLVALDVGLDTSTADGRVAARRLLADAAAHGPRPPRQVNGVANSRPAAARRVSTMGGRGR